MKAKQIFFSVVVALSFLPIAHAQTASPDAKNWRKYDFALVRKDGVSNWGSWEGMDLDRLRQRGPGLYVHKDSNTFQVTDPGIVQQAEREMAEFRKKADHLKKVKNVDKNEERAKEMALRAKEDGEYQSKLGAEISALAQKMRERNTPESRAEFKAKLAEIKTRIKANTFVRRESLRNGQFAKEMHEFGEGMRAAAHETGEKIDKLIDQAFAKGAVKRL